MSTMRAYARMFEQNHVVEQIEVPIPDIEENEVLVNVRAFGVGIHDRYFVPTNVTFPYTIGSEGAGVVVRMGEKVANLNVGDNVFFTSGLQPKGGCWSEYIVLPAQNVIGMPDQLNFTEAATIPVAGKTALESMHALDLKAGDSLFIAGASGAIGTLVIQLAGRQGIRVVGSASKKNHNYMRSLGSEETVDYKNPDWKQKVKEWMPTGVDAALAIQPGTAKDSMDVVKDGGKVITVSGDTCAPERDVIVQQFQHGLDMQQTLSSIAQDVADGQLRIVIEQVYSFDDALVALEKTETRHARGKVVVAF